MNGTLISPQTDTYRYKAFIEGALNHDREDGRTILAHEGWHNSLDVPDDGDADEYSANMLETTHNDYKAARDEKKALVNSRVQFLAGKRVTLKLRPNLEVFHLSKLLIPGIQIQIDMYFNNPAVRTICWAGAIALRLTELDVHVRLILAQVRVTPSIYREIMSVPKVEKWSRAPR